MNDPQRQTTVPAPEEIGALRVKYERPIQQPAPTLKASGGPGQHPATPVRPNHELIAALAYQYWVERGLPEQQNWEQAETQLWFNFVRAVDNFRG